MGVRGLTTFLEGKPVWEELELSNTPVIIDGNALFIYIYCELPSLDCVHLGQFKEFADRVRRFFGKLHQHGIKPYVVMDGLYEGDKKLATIRSRIESTFDGLDHWLRGLASVENSGVPPLGHPCFIQVLHEIGVDFALADFEADREIALLSRDLKCPVISNDSDFFIFNTGQYYIPVDELDWSSNAITCKACRSERVAEQLGISVDLLPLLASLSGNDYTSHKGLPLHQLIKRECNKFVSLGRLLSSAKTPDEGLVALNQRLPKNRRIQLEDVADSLKEYQLEDQSYLKTWFESRALQTNLKPAIGHSVPDWLLRLFREGKCPGQFVEVMCNRRMILGAQIEDVRATSCQKCCLPLRRAMYKMFFPPGQRAIIGEWGRAGKSLKKRRIKLEDNQSEMVLPTVFERLDSQAERRRVILDILSADFVPDTPEEWQLPVAVLQYWCKNAISRITLKHLEALLIVHVTNEQLNISEEVFDPEALHAFAQWIVVLKTVMCLNSLLQCPFPVPSIHRLFDGPTAFLVHDKLKNGSEYVIENKVERGLFQTLKSAVLENLGDSKLDMDDAREEKHVQHQFKDQSSKKGWGNKAATIEHLTNRFTLLPDDDSS